MQTTHFSNIIIPENRQRRTFDPKRLEELDKSMNGVVGLMHPIVLREVDGKLHLVAGEHRLKVLITRAEHKRPTNHNGVSLPLGEIPYVNLGQLSTIEAEEAELEENIRRVDLSWQERAVAEARLHGMRSAQAEAAGRTQTVADTAREARGYASDANISGHIQQQVSQNLTLAKHLDDPDVAKAKTQKEALKVVQRKAEATKREILAARFDMDAAANLVPHELLIGDMRTHLKDLPDGKYQVLITDPPYGIDADSFGEQSSARHEYSDSPEYFRELANVLAEESFRVCADAAHTYVFCDPRRFEELKLVFELALWEVWPTPLVWVKNTGMLPRPDHGPRRNYEFILYAIKGSKRVNVVRGDTLIHPSVRGITHGAQKPVALYKDLLERSASPGDWILDPFAGSGTVFAVANSLRLRATGIEANPQYAATAKLRLLRSDDFTSDEEAGDSAGSNSDGSLSGLDEALGL